MSGRILATAGEAIPVGAVVELDPHAGTLRVVHRPDPAPIESTLRIDPDRPLVNHPAAVLDNVALFGFGLTKVTPLTDGLRFDAISPADVTILGRPLVNPDDVHRFGAQHDVDPVLLRRDPFLAERVERTLTRTVARALETNEHDPAAVPIRVRWVCVAEAAAPKADTTTHTEV